MKIKDWNTKAGWILLALVAIALLSGCATLLGSASYSYEKSATGDCKVLVNSRRDVAGPVEVEVDKDCKLSAKTGSLQGGGLTPTETAILNRAIDVVLPVAPAPAATPEGDLPRP